MKDITNNLKKYFDKADHESSIDILKTPTVSFHWSNHKKSTRFFKPVVNHTLKNDFIHYELAGTFIKLSMDELYTYAVKSINKKENHDFWYNYRAISFYGPSGPFEEMSMAELIDSEVLKQYAWLLLSKNKIPQRSFRLDIKEDVLLCYDHNFLKDSKVRLLQVSQTGLVFALKDEELIQEFIQSEKIKIYLSTNSFEEQTKLYSESEKDAVIIDSDCIETSLNLLSGIDSTVHMFIKFKNINDKEFVQKFQNFLISVEKSIYEASA